MSRTTSTLVLCGLSALVLAGSPNAVSARRAHKKAEVQKPSDPPADAKAAPAVAKPAAPPTPADKPAAPVATSPARAGGSDAAAAPPKELATDASGPKQEAARAHFERGVELYSSGDFPNAWLEFNSAYQLVPLIDLLNNLARCEVRMGRQRDALEHFKRFIVARPSDPDSENIRVEVARLEGEVGRTASPATDPLLSAPPPPAAPRRWPVYGILFGATALASLIAGGATLGIVNSRYNDLSSRCPGSCPAADVESLRQSSYAGYGLLAAGGALALTSGIFLFIETRTPKEAALRPIAQLSLTPTGVIGRF
jgi:tetratricopeptide (TPR) repeat protein